MLLVLNNELIYWLDVALQNGYISKQQYNQANELTQQIIKILVVMIAINQKSELLVHNKQGRIREKNSYGNDPYPPRG
ncbi:four helix bundle protein [Lysinibacillus sp. NPDC056185]|uniref:four helix bundle protein n=1 Tax=Lysinibacillus sp. NPDC056185 TaxID=3345739 RepID=UPI0039F010D2